VSQPRRPQRLWLAVTVIIVAMGVAGGVLGLWRWQHGAHVFDDGGNGTGGRMKVGHTVYSLALYSVTRDNATVDLRSITPRVAVNTAHAAIQVLECQRNGNIVTFGAVPRVDYCNHLKSFAPGNHQFSANGDKTAIILAITARQTGRIVINGVDVRYHSGVRQGHQNTGSRMDFHAR
jgi:DNA-binding transcriptional regulator of glucitol operon